MNAKYISLVSTAIAYGYQYIIRVLPSVTMNGIVEKFNVSVATFGNFSGIYYIGYAAAHIPFGIFLDRLGLKLAFIISMFMAFIGLTPIFFDSWEMMVIGRFISGFGSAGCTLCMIKAIGHYFPNSFSKILGISASFGLACAIFGGKPFILLIDSYGVNNVVSGVIIAGVVLLALGIMLESAKSKSSDSIGKSLISVFLNKRLYLICLFAGFMIGTLEGFADMWAVKLFTEERGFDIGNAAFLSSMVFLGMGIGCPFIGYITDKILKHHLIAFICGIVMFFGVGMLLMFDISNAYLISVIMIIIGIASAYQIPVIGKAALLATNGTLGLTTSYANMLLMSFGYIFHFIIGSVSESTGSIIHGVSIVPTLSIIGAIGFLLLSCREKSCQK